jgi:hypothetical protein
MPAQTASSRWPTVPVTADNFIRAETDRTFAGFVSQGAFGRLTHFRDLAPIEDQSVPRGNRDTLYSIGIFDLEAGTVTIALPDAGTRFMTMIVIDEDHYAQSVSYGGGTHVLTEATVGTRYALVGIRILVDPRNPSDLATVHALQDRIRIDQNGPGRFDIPDWDSVSQDQVRDALTMLGASLPDWRRAAGRRDEVDPVRHLIVTATGWGLSPDRDAIYLNVVPDRNDGATTHRLTVKDVPVDGFWSISVYNKDGFFEKNALNSYSLNNITAEKDFDGSVTVQFGGCGESSRNCLPIMPGWNYTVRLYRPRASIRDGAWKFPEAQPVH